MKKSNLKQVFPLPFPTYSLLILLLSLNCSAPVSHSQEGEDRNSIHSVSQLMETNGDISFEKRKLGFIENLGQLPGSNPALYYLEEAGMQCLLKRDGLTYLWKSKQDNPTSDSFFYQVHRVDICWKGANPQARILSSLPNSDLKHYYTTESSGSVMNVQSYQEIRYENIYDQIDLKLYFQDQHMKYDFIVKPGGNISDIALMYQGQDSLYLDANGELILHNPLGTLREEKPYTYQIQEDQAQEISSRYTLAKNILRFEVEAYEETKDLIIDPSIIWSTFYGTEEHDAGLAVCTDPEGNVYMAGRVDGYHYDFAPDIYQPGQDYITSTYKGDTDAFLVKFAPNGNRIWALYYGGEEEDVALSVCTDANANVIMSGYTQSNSGIAYNGHDETYNEANGDGNRFDRDAFLVKFNEDGIRSWGTYVGGEDVETTGDTRSEEGCSVGTDPSGNIYLTGFTSSTTQIATNISYDDTHNGGFDAFLTKFSGNGTRLWSTYFGGSENDRANCLSVNSHGEVYIAGSTESTGLGHDGHDNSYSEDIDGFMAKFDPDGDLYWSTYYGGQGVDEVHSIVTDDIYVYLAGMTTSSNYIATNNGHDHLYNGGSDNFLVKFNFFGFRLWGTYFGGSGDEGYIANHDFSTGPTTSVCLSPNGEIYLAGITTSTHGIVTNNPLQSSLNDGQNSNGSDGYIARYFPDGDLKWASYIGGESGDAVSGVTASPLGEVYVGGFTSSDDYPTLNGHQNMYAGDVDPFLTKIDIYGEGGPGGPDDVDSGGRQDDPYGQKDPRFTLAPNPSYGKTTARYEGASKGPFQIEVLNKQGKTVYRSKELKGLSKETLDLTHLRKGLYFVTLQSASEKYSEELLIK